MTDTGELERLSDDALQKMYVKHNTAAAINREKADMCARELHRRWYTQFHAEMTRAALEGKG